MSCYHVHPHHINTLVSFGHSRRVSAWIPAGSSGQSLDCYAPELVALVLHRANAAAVAERYGDPIPDELPPFELVRELPSAVAILKACACFDYQSSDWSGYDGSAAELMIDELRRAAIRELPGYDEAPWELRPPRGRLPRSIDRERDYSGLVTDGAYMAER
jgi:hypothetical protein